MISPMRILVVEDFPPLSRAIVQGLQEAGYAVDSAGDGEEGLASAQACPYDVILLDIMLPKLDGLSLLHQLRKQHHPAAVLLLTAKDTVADRVMGLDAGADDYLVKPFAFEEVLARVRAMARRRYGQREAQVVIDDLEVDLVARTVTRAGRPIALSAREYAVLEYLCARRGHVVTRMEIWDHVYDFATEPSSNVVDVYIGYLRRKIDADHPHKLIRTRRGQGYVLGEPE
ncbi:response regulator transcription factor [Myxococcus sp. K15C18031901]|uniref:response regulator transcription factor n=1 Tax=Myxococcus dinghuensis TaxID=2906761 RepID=UPI0020A76D2F|nr:response regulator [Myxococcus dinghuensis]MCP3099874.1 response regulator transcription factor [Myxococcus dinghuensis]